jgi:drug/metabolite transporter (DMT)-like permease
MASIRRAYVAWAVVCVVWGTTYLAIRISLESIPPLLMAALRWIAAGSILIGVLKIGGTLPRPHAWPALTLLGMLLLGFGNRAVVWAEQTVPSGSTAVLVATVPFWMVGIDALMRDGEALSLRRLAGLAVGFAGVSVLVWPEMRAGAAASGYLAGVVSTQVACVGWAAGSFIFWFTAELRSYRLPSGVTREIDSLCFHTRVELVTDALSE